MLISSHAVPWKIIYIQTEFANLQPVFFFYVHVTRLMMFLHPLYNTVYNVVCQFNYFLGYFDYPHNTRVSYFRIYYFDTVVKVMWSV